MNNNVKKQEKFLAALDMNFENFSKKCGFNLTKNSKDWPERSICWKEKDINKLLQIYLKNESEHIFIVWGCAWKDKDADRFWRKSGLKEMPIPINWRELKRNFMEIKNGLDKVQDSDLRPTQ